MEVLNFIFRIGVVLAVYNFIWWLITIGISVLFSANSKSITSVYFIKLIRYLFLVDVIFLFTIHRKGEIILNDFILAGLIMLVYFIGKIQKNHKNQNLFNFYTDVKIQGMENPLKRLKTPFNIKYEIGVVLLSISLYGILFIQPNWAYNAISTWFLESILDIESTPIFGFIFKVIGFFFLLSVISKLVNGILYSFAPKNHYDNKRNEGEDFDDYTEID